MDVNFFKQLKRLGKENTEFKSEPKKGARLKLLHPQPAGRKGFSHPSLFQNSAVYNLKCINSIFPDLKQHGKRAQNNQNKPNA